MDNAERRERQTVHRNERQQSLLACRRLPPRKQSLRCWHVRFLLVEFALHGLPGRRVVPLLPFERLLHGLRQPLLRVHCSSCAFLASELTLYLFRYEHGRKNWRAGRLRQQATQPCTATFSQQFGSREYQHLQCGKTTICGCRGTTALQSKWGGVGLSHRGSRRINGKLTASKCSALTTLNLRFR